jgi:pyrroloquinoline quinone (PQQ) biosynthesis protein C
MTTTTPASPPTPTDAPAAAFSLAPDQRSDWLLALQREVESHPAVNHLLLCRLATGRFTKGDFGSFSVQHHALVGLFTTYMELLLFRAPSPQQKLWLAKVLVDEYGEGSDGEDHATLYRQYLRSLGVPEGSEDRTPLCSEVWQFVGEHLRICREEPFLVGLGALGPGHEWSIPRMFSHIIPGLARAGLSRDERLYFDLHTEQDLEHARWMTEALQELATTPEQQADVRRGALLSLRARYRLWTGIERRIVERRQPFSVEVARKGLIGASRAPVSMEDPGDLPALTDAVQRHFAGAPWPAPMPSPRDGELIP